MMVRILSASCVAALLLAAAVPARADEDAKAVVARAIRAHGGAEKLNKLQASTTKSKGKFYGMGEGIDFTGQTFVQIPDRVRMEVEGEAGGTKFKFAQIVNGNKGWIVLNDNPQPMDKDVLAEAREQLYVGRLTHLAGLMGPGYKLSPLGEVKVGDREAVGVRVQHEGHRDVNLFFDKKSNLLLKTEARGKDVQGGGGEFTQETFYGDYKKAEGVPVARKVTIKRDGKLFVESELTDVKLSEKLDDRVFARPK